MAELAWLAKFKLNDWSAASFHRSSQVRNRTVVVDMLFPKMLPSGSLPEGAVFVSLFRSGTQAAKVAQQRNQRPGRQQPRVTIGAPVREEPPASAIIQDSDIQPPARQPAAHMRHQVDLLRSRALRITWPSRSPRNPSA